MPAHLRDSTCEQFPLEKPADPIQPVNAMLRADLELIRIGTPDQHVPLLEHTVGRRVEVVLYVARLPHREGT